jgi:hypothetical protein
MNKNAIQKYAVWARNELIEQIEQRAYQYGINDKGYGDENATVIAGRVLSADEKRQRTAFVHEIQKHGYQQAVEEVAYTWFNRFVALRYMEVNDYLPTHVRVFSDASGSFNPEILKDVLHLELEGLDRSKVSELLNANQTEELYRYLLLTQCNALNEALPEMFEKLGSYTEILLPNNILKPDSVLGHLVKDIDEDDFDVSKSGQVEIIGWMYQYYNSEPKDTLINARSKYKMPDIPFVTQLFTSDWIVRFMVDNSLGRLWLESHPNTELKANWKYYLDEAEQSPEVVERLRVLCSQSPVKSPEDIRLIDPCMGSGHILVYAFDVLMQIYESEGYNPRDAAKLILEKNIYGLDIDRRAYQLAYFSLMMKARQYNRRIFTDDIKPQVYYPAGWSDGEEYGSLVKVDTLPPMPEMPKDQLTIFDDYERDIRVWNFKRLLAQKYDVVVTNPPYLNMSYMPDRLKGFILENYSDYKSDMFSAYFQQTKWLCKPNGHIGLLSPYVWMFISSHEKARELVVRKSTITSMVQLEYNAFEAACIPVAAFTMLNSHIQGLAGEYIRLSDFKGIEVQEPKTLEAVNNRFCGYRFSAPSDNFEKIPGCPIAYWVSDATYKIFDSRQLNEIADAKQGMATSDNNRFLRCWFEVSKNRIGFSYTSTTDAEKSKLKWFPYNKGGDFRRWYGNCEFVVNWENDGFEIKNSRNEKGKQLSRPQSLQFMFRESLSWSKISNSTIAFRYFPNGFLFDVAGCSAFVKGGFDKFYLLGFVNSIVAQHILYITSPTMNYEVGHISNLPIIENRTNEVSAIVNTNVALARTDWDAFETSWDFKRNPLLCGEQTVAAAFDQWEHESAERFDALKTNEEELNRIFIDIYSLQDELSPEVEDKDVTVRPANLGREIRSLISYAVGCMFGRYSLDVDGLAYAGGDWDAGKYKTFIPDKDNILPICDDEYFDDDIVGRFVDFVRVVYGAETLEENLKFIADALGGKGTPREVIRNYFLNDFYADHCKIYQKRPIYWLFDSGKKNGFKALVYLHRYSRDLLAKLRTDYVHEQQERYRTQLAHVATALNTATGAERARLLKQQDKLTEQLKEITAFEEKVHHLADQNIEIDLDDGVKKNYEIFTDVLAKI